MYLIEEKGTALKSSAYKEVFEQNTDSIELRTATNKWDQMKLKSVCMAKNTMIQAKQLHTKYFCSAKGIW